MSVVEPVGTRAVRSGFLAYIGSRVGALSEKRRVQTEEELTLIMSRCRQLMEWGDCDAEAFERAAILLHRASRFDDEIAMCVYVRRWAAWREREYLFGEAMWLNARFKRIMAREARARACLARGR